ncbi:hypothetical protein, partial [Burkholderia oklahomensis]|uniref:hypothetical protein n=1 Tax=Burkholderia oklahomensis TaxID=342113 RepID=UPI001E5FCA21
AGRMRAAGAPRERARRIRTRTASGRMLQGTQRAASSQRRARDEAWTLPYNADSHGGVFR